MYNIKSIDFILYMIVYYKVYYKIYYYIYCKVYYKVYIYLCTVYCTYNDMVYCANDTVGNVNIDLIR